MPVIAGIEITTDDQGRFSLNTLHRANGGRKAKSPNKWFENQVARDLIAELESQTPNSGFGVLSVKKGGNAPGTFAHEILAVEYAGWISPAFRIQMKNHLQGDMGIPLLR